MKNSTILWAVALFAVVAGLLAAATASAQVVVYTPPVAAVYAGRYAAYPYGAVVYNPRRTYRQAVRYGYAPVFVPAAPVITRGPTDYFGRPMYGPPYYAYPRPPISYGANGYDYRPVPAAPQPSATAPSAAAVETPPPPAPAPATEAIPAPAAEAIPMPPTH